MSYDRDSEFIAWGNGKNDDKGYSRSRVPGYITSQQFAAFIGRNQGTARDIMQGRRGPALGKQFGRNWFVSYEMAIDYAQRHCLDR